MQSIYFEFSPGKNQIGISDDIYEIVDRSNSKHLPLNDSDSGFYIPFHRRGEHFNGYKNNNQNHDAAARTYPFQWDDNVENARMIMEVVLVQRPISSFSQK